MLSRIATLLLLLAVHPACAEQHLSKELLQCEKETRGFASPSNLLGLRDYPGWKRCVSTEADRMGKMLAEHYDAIIRRAAGDSNEIHNIESLQGQWQEFRNRYCGTMGFYTHGGTSYAHVMCNLRVMLMELGDLRDTFADHDKHSPKSDIQQLLNLGRTS